MSIFCVCDGTLLNTGTPTRKRVIADGVKIFAVQLVADDGTRNSILSTDTLNQAYFDALVANTDKSKRWFPIGTFENVTDERADPISETFSSGASVITQQGVRSFTGWLIDLAAAYVGKLQSFTCAKFGIYTIDECGNLVGSVSADGTKLYPIEVNGGSWDPRLIKRSDTLSGKVQLSFQFSQLESDANLRMILAEEMASDVDLLNTTGLLSASTTITNEATTGFTVALKVNYDGFTDPTVVTGRTTAGFTLYNVTDSASVTVTGATEAPDGTYAITYAAQTSADILRLTGIEDSIEIETTLITIP